VTIETGADNDQLSIKARRGTLSNNGNKVFLQDDVVAVSTTDKGQTVLTSDDMTYLPNSNRATNKGPFKLKSPQVKLSGSGLDANFTNEVFIIKSKVRATHEPI
jgi:LPS export ABC transporter protein LptC